MKQGERGVAMDEALLQTLLHETTLAVAATDATGTMQLMSPALQAMLQTPYQPVDEQGMPEYLQVHDETGERLLRPEEVPISRARAGESVRDARVTVHLRDGTLKHLRCNGAPLRHPDGSIRGGIVLVADVTAEQLALAEQRALRDRLIETVSHELRTPLTSMLGHAELLDELDLDLPATARRSLGAVIAAGRRLEEVVTTVSDLADLADVSRLELSGTDVAELLRKTLGDAGPAADERDLTLAAELPGRIDALVCPVRLRRAVAALLDNALTYAPAGSTVRVRARADETVVRIEVSDTGPGIAARDRERLVQPFERGSDASTPVSSRGLGLAVAHTAAVAHGGTLTLGDSVPRGLTACLCVPLAGSDPHS